MTSDLESFQCVGNLLLCPVFFLAIITVCYVYSFHMCKRDLPGTVVGIEDISVSNKNTQLLH